MKKLFKLFLSLIICALTITLSSCSKYISSYKAIGLVRMNTLSKVETSFYSLEGTLVFKVKNPSKDSECDIDYFVQVDKGEVSIYYDNTGTKEKLVTVTKGQSIEDKGANIEKGESVYIIIEASKGSRGKVIARLD